MDRHPNRIRIVIHRVLDASVCRTDARKMATP